MTTTQTKWPIRPLSECGRWVSGGTPSKSVASYWNGDIPWISSKSLKSFELSDSEDRITDAAVANGAHLVPEGTVMFVVRGMSLANEFRVGVTTRPVAFNQDLRAILPEKGIDGRYLTRFLKSHEQTVLGLTNNASHGTKRLPTEQLKTISVPVPPISEQRRIAAILDKADAIWRKRDEGIRLTEELLRSAFLTMFGDPVQNEKGWPVVKVEEAGQVQLGRQRAPKYQSGKHTHPYLRVANVFEDRIDISDVLSMDFDDSDFKTYRLRHGDILLNEGQSTELVGRPAMWREELPECCFQNTLIRFRANPEKMEPEFALEVFLYYLRKGQFARLSSKTSSVAHLGAGRFAEMPIPLPPLKLQRQYAEKRRHIHTLHGKRRGQVQEANQLFGSLVQHAFRGEL